MPPKKKTDSEKASVKKTRKSPAKSAAKPSVGIKKSAAKKVTPKSKVVAAKSVAKRKSAVAKSTPNSKNIAASAASNPLGLKSGWSIFSASVQAFSSIWWRFWVLLLMVGVGVILSVLLTGALTFALFGGIAELQNLATSIFFGVDLSTAALIKLGIGLVFGATLILIIHFLFTISTLLLVKNYIDQKPKNPLTTMFLDSLAFFWRAAWLSVRVVWYILWPALVVVPAGFLVALAHDQFAFDLQSGWIVIVGAIILGLLLIGVLVYRSVCAMFAMPALIHFDCDPNAAFNHSLGLLAGNWFRIFWIVLLVSLGIGFAFFIVFDLPAILVPGLYFGSEVIQTIISFFIVSPIVTTFYYFLMLHVTQVKSVAAPK